ncbi:hypothetical protein Tco_0855478, partial [Tanacetum coccineum]
MVESNSKSGSGDQLNCDNVNTYSDASDEHCHRTDHVVDANAFPNRSSGNISTLGLRYLSRYYIRPLDANRTMAITSKLDSTREDKDEMIIAEPEITAISDLRPIHCNKTIEAVVYRKWTSKHVHTQQPMKYCCILMDKQVRLSECKVFIARFIAVMIFTVHNANKVLQNAVTAIFDFMALIVDRCIQLIDHSTSFLLPSIMIFIERCPV